MNLGLGEEVPVIGYTKQNAHQVVYAGMEDVDTYKLLVRAQSGDTASYTIDFVASLDDDANLINLELQGMEFTFTPSVYEYTIELPEGYDLPNLLITSKSTQHTALHTVSDTEQQVIVTAQSDGCCSFLDLLRSRLYIYLLSIHSHA